MKLTRPTTMDRIRVWLRSHPEGRFTARQLALDLPSTLGATRAAIGALARNGVIVQVGEVPARSAAYAPQKVWKKRNP